MYLINLIFVLIKAAGECIEKRRRKGLKKKAEDAQKARENAFKVKNQVDKENELIKQGSEKKLIESINNINHSFEEEEEDKESESASTDEDKLNDMIFEEDQGL